MLAIVQPMYNSSGQSVFSENKQKYPGKLFIRETKKTYPQLNCEGTRVTSNVTSWTIPKYEYTELTLTALLI